MNPQFPLYIVSKGRWESRLTSKSLERMGIPYFVIVESQEYDRYSSVIDSAKLLVLDPKYKDVYDTFSEDPALGGGKGTGSGPARNYAWDHSISLGFKWHWVMDDNIRCFYRLNRNLRVKVTDGTVFRCMEDFCLRYTNVGMGGPNYLMFVPRRYKRKPFITNTRIYSCNLIRNDLPMRWRGRYNEDTDLSLRMIKSGHCTILFNAFLQNKATTLTMKGGNTDTIYTVGTMAKSQMLKLMHPDVVEVVWKYGRWHHWINYRPFQRYPKLRRLDGLESSPNIDINEYGMTLINLPITTL